MSSISAPLIGPRRSAFIIYGHGWTGVPGGVRVGWHGPDMYECFAFGRVKTPDGDDGAEEISRRQAGCTAP